MELLIAGGIALIGYGVSVPGRGARKDRPKYAKQLGPSNEYSEPGNDTRGLTLEHVRRAEQRWLEARDPGVTGLVTPHTRLGNAQLPFYTSARKQNTNEAFKQTRLETFTGVNGLDTSLTGTYRNKREVEAMFAPSYTAQAVTSAGTSGNPMYARQDARFQASPWQNNVLPAEKVYVGRGVGVGPDVAATDGFHPMHRVMLKNVGEYKKNNLPGGVIHGASRVAKTTTPRQVSVNNHPGALVYDQERRPPMPIKAAVLAPQVHPELVTPLKAPKPMDQDRFGNPTRAGPEARGAREDRIRYDCGDNPDRNHSMPQLNAAASHAGMGAFSHASFDASRFHTQQREHAGHEGFVAGPKGRQLPAGQILPPTQRDMTQAAPMGGVGVIRSSGEVRRPDAAKTTLRDTQGANTMLTGTKAAVQGGMLDNVWRYKRLGREAKRGDMLMEHTPVAGRLYTQQGVEGMGAAAMRDDSTAVQAPMMPSIPNKQYHQNLGQRTAPVNKLPMANPRLDLDMAVDQLRDNPYAKPLWETT